MRPEERKLEGTSPPHPFSSSAISLIQGLGPPRDALTAWKGASSPNGSGGGGAGGVNASEERKVVRPLGREKESKE